MCAVVPTIRKREHSPMMAEVMTTKHESNNEEAGQCSFQVSRGKKRRRVMFSASTTTYEVKNDTASSSWVSRKDYDRFREDAFILARRTNIEGLPVDHLLNDTTFTSHLNHPDIKEKQQAKLSYFVRHAGEQGRGLENLISRSLGSARRRNRSRTIRAVLIGQGIARKHMYDKEQMTTLLAFVSQKYSAKAKEFARNMGEADAKQFDAPSRY